MVIDYYCFSMDNLNQKNYSKLKAEHGAYIFDNLNFDIKAAKKLGKLAVFVKETGKFYDDKKREISLAGKVVFPRCTIPDEKELYSALESSGAVLAVTRQDNAIVEDWPKHINPIYRDVEAMTYQEFLDNFDSLRQKYGKVFFKTRNKNISCLVLDVVKLQGGLFSTLHSDSELLESDRQNKEEISEAFYMVFTNQYKTGNDYRFNFLNRNEEVFVQPYLNLVKDKKFTNIPVEYRSFVVDGQFVTSRSWVPSKVVPEEVKKLTQSIIDIMPENMNKTFVVDVLEFEDGEEKKYDLCELNPISSSGYEQGSTIFVLEDGLRDWERYYPKSDSDREEEKE